MASSSPIFFLLFFLSLTLSSSQNDTASLLFFRAHADLHGHLLSNWTLPSPSSTACSAAWIGVTCIISGDSSHRVSSLSLPSLSLRGPIDSLSSLDQLRFLDLSFNRLNGTVSKLLSSVPNLKLVYLSHNDFSGDLTSFFSRRLLRLDLSDNNFDGPLPSNLSNLPRLLTLRLHNNAFSGKIPESLSASLPTSLAEFNLSNNELFGPVPNSLIKRFGSDSFSGNEGLCGNSPLPDCSFSGFPPSASAQTVPSNPSSLPSNLSAPKNETEKIDPKRGGVGHGIFVALIVTNSVLATVVLLFVAVYCCKRCGGGDGGHGSYGEGSEKRRSGSSYNSDKNKVFANNGGGGTGAESDSTNATDKSKLVFFDRKKQFELEDLLKASAEMLGKGSLGTVYRAVLDDGATVAVKRLKDANPCGRKEFEQYMDVIGRLKHPNIVRLRAYYYAREEKLLVYDYLPNGSLYALLHGNRGPGRIPLDWTTRISLVLGAARGLARIHTEYNSSKIPHGNVKSSNILLDKNGVACISDFGLALLLNPVHAITRLGGYKSPEQSETKRLSQEADVYSFGVLLLEVLTGKCPSQFPSPPPYPRIVEEEVEQSADLPKWVRSVVRDEWTAEVFDQELLRYKNIEEELVAMLHVGMACVVAQPEKRPTMVEVTKMIEEIRVEQSPLGEDYDESRNSLSPSLATTEDAVVGVY
ncbi:hypothetical protein V2J09_012032 [Rumex salicifolius]